MPAELVAYLPTFEAIQHYLCTLEPPRWEDDPDLEPVDTGLAAEGEAVFARDCAGCHGDYRGGAFPNLVATPAEIGTDTYRAEAFTAREADWFNGFMPGGASDMTVTHGYVAPDLTGVWASAPYLHNGSVPTLRAVLQPDTRPARWRRVDGYDPADVGLVFETVETASDRDTVEGRRVVDTSIEAMDNRGHAMALTPAEVDALLAYLKTL